MIMNAAVDGEYIVGWNGEALLEIQESREMDLVSCKDHGNK